MAKQKVPGKEKTKRFRAGNRKGKTITMRGLKIPIPPELGLPAGAPFEGRPQPGAMQIPKDIQEMFGPLIEMATNAWRLKVRMIDPDSGEPKEETRKLYRFVEGLFRALGDAGIQVIDKTDKPYDSGMPEKVISFEQTPGLLKEEIIDTVRPTVRWKERHFHYGEIIVGIPVIEPPSEAAIAVDPSGQEAKGDVAEDESASTGAADTQEQENLVAPQTSAQTETPEQAEKE